VLLSGSGVYDGSEIHESVSVLLSLSQQGAQVQCFAPNRPQYHVVDHAKQSEASESRNILTEAARIARGNIQVTFVYQQTSSQQAD
jgi:enhancing lycopene biosynthesis protein 2